MAPLQQEKTALTSEGAVQLVQRIKSGSLSATEVVKAYLQRMDEVQPVMNAMVYRRDELALSEAAAADQKQARGEPLGPLHGLPITVKECFALAGSCATMGLPTLANEPAEEDGVLVDRLKKAGAIILGKTNVPQLMLMHETDSPMFGRANHPLNSERSPGGSSGGEAAILSAGGSALGLASDLGGSIRQPAHSTGICGLMPTVGRLTVSGCRRNYPRLQAIRLQPGPMARCVEDLSLAMQVLSPVNSTEAQPDETLLPWQDPGELDLRGVRIGMFCEDGIFNPSPAIRRAVQESGQCLREAGLEVEPFIPPGMDELLELYIGLLSADGMSGLTRTLAHNPVDWRIRRLLKLGSLPNWTRPLLSSICSLRGQTRLARLLRISGKRSADGYLQLVGRLGDWCERFFLAMQKQGFSALLMPAHGLPALTHGSSAHLLSAASYCFLPNLLGIPAGVVPVTHVRSGEESDRPNSRDITDQTAKLVEQGSTGLPVGVQVAALPWQEDLVLAIMSKLEAGANLS